jgi:ribosomal protein S18 acetylase RimI-like enzyme
MADDTIDAADDHARSANVTFREATGDDVAELVTIVESAYRGDSSRLGWTTEADLLGGQRTDAEGVAAIIAAPTSRILVAVADNGALLACCQLERHDDAVCYFGMFAVSPQLQGAGIGHRLLAEAERSAHLDWQADTMEMMVIRQRGDLIAWYERRGYEVTAETRPFPYGDARYGLPRRDDLAFAVLVKTLN